MHEFGHHLAALADEYYTSDVAYEPAADRLEPWEPNVTALLDPAELKWANLVAPGTPLPTPWGKEAFEARSREIQTERRKIRAEKRPEAEMDALFTRQRDEEEKRFAAEPFAGKAAPSKARTTKPRATTGRPPTASCSPATASRSAPSAGTASSA